MTMTHDTSFDPLRMDRRVLLKSAGCAAGLGVLRPGHAAGQDVAPLLRFGTRMLDVNGRSAKVFQVTGPNGQAGIMAREGDRFQGTLLNDTGEPVQMHWHGQVLAPNDQDRARPGGGALAAGQRDVCDFVLTPGTHWMHDHTLAEQLLLAAPMVTLEKDVGDVQQVVIMLHDFAFRSPMEILEELGGSDAHAGHGAAASAPRAAGPDPRGHGAHGAAVHHGAHGGPQSMPGHGQAVGAVHANDVRYDAYLANDRTLEDPAVIRIDRGGRVRLRIINAATASGFFITTPGLTTQVLAVDGSPTAPLSAAQYPLAPGQRLDLLAEVPSAGGAFPVLAQVEDARFLTGVVLATPAATIARRASQAGQKVPLLDLGLDSRLTAVAPLAVRPPDRRFTVLLGEKPGYRWTINDRIHGEHDPFRLRQGERVEMTFMNPTSMMHPMHLHGHHFQVVAIGGRRVAGPVRDTVIVPPHLPVTIAFDATLKGAWYLHCHHLYHMAAGMMTEVVIA
jgi:FtsP/CotA-like multicopper oxidase with cupredoxin domain